MASGGYPGSYSSGIPIQGLESVPPPVQVFHAGTRRLDGTLCTAGGRVLGVTALGNDLAEARKAAYAAVNLIHFEGAQFRQDIAVKGL
jgi:phosphoribosylamine--glycine ligase